MAKGASTSRGLDHRVEMFNLSTSAIRAAKPVHLRSGDVEEKRRRCKMPKERRSHLPAIQLRHREGRLPGIDPRNQGGRYDANRRIVCGLPSGIAEGD